MSRPGDFVLEACANAGERRVAGRPREGILSGQRGSPSRVGAGETSSTLTSGCAVLFALAMAGLYDRPMQGRSIGSTALRPEKSWVTELLGVRGGAVGLREPQDAANSGADLAQGSVQFRQGRGEGREIAAQSV